MMKLHRLILTVLLLATVSFSASAQTKIATVDMKKLFNGYYKTKLSQTSLDALKTDLNRDLKKMADDYTQMQADYKQLLEQSSDPAISQDERDKRKQAAANKAKDIAALRTDLERAQRQNESRFADQSQRMSFNIVTEIQKFVSDQAKADGYTVVLNSASPEIVVFASPDNDITATVLAKMNAGAPIDVSAPASGGSLLNMLSTNAP